MCWGKMLFLKRKVGTCNKHMQCRRTYDRHVVITAVLITASAGISAPNFLFFASTAIERKGMGDVMKVQSEIMHSQLSKAE